MRQNKYVVIGGVSAAVLVLAGGGFAWWQASQDTQDDTKPVASRPDTRRPSTNVIPLTQTGPAAPKTGGLKVTPSDPKSSVPQLNGSGQRGVAGATSSGGGASAASQLNPSTFGQYDKYKDAAGALFGELQVGNGPELAAGRKAAVLYRGWLTNGQLFDQSRTGSDGRLQPFVFTMGDHQVIPGWEQALAGMKPGGVRLLIVPPAVGYGATGQGPIPGGAVLIFQVQLLEVQ